MVVYYINKISERLADYRYPIEEGDVCMLYDGELVKTVYIDGEKDFDSIWRDFKFVDTKSLKSYHFPKEDSILCAPFGEKHALGDANLLTQLIQYCKGEWLLDFLNETSAVLSGFVDYWDLEILKRLIGNDDIKTVYADEEIFTEFIAKPIDEEVDDEEDDDFLEDDDNTSFLPKSYDIKWFCLSALSCIEDQIDKRSYEILESTLKGESRRAIAEKHGLTQERIRQIFVKATKQTKDLLEAQRKNLEEVSVENTRLKVQVNLLKEDVVRLKALVPKVIQQHQNDSDRNIDEEVAALLETPIIDMSLSARASNILLYMGINKFADIAQIESVRKLWDMRNSGRKTVNEVSRLLEDFHLTFSMSYAEIVDTLVVNDWQAAKRKWMGGFYKKKEIKESTENPQIIEHPIGDIEHEGIPENKAEEDNHDDSDLNITLSDDEFTFVPKGKMKNIGEVAEESYDFLVTLAVIEFMQFTPQPTIITFDRLACMMIAMAWEILNEHEDTRGKEETLCECIHFLMNESKEGMEHILTWNSSRKDVFNAIKDYPMADIFEDTVDMLTEDAPYNVLKAWIRENDKDEIVRSSNVQSSTCLYGIHPMKRNPYIEVKQGWMRYLRNEHACLMKHFKDLYLNYLEI